MSWTLVYANDAAGNSTEGSLDSLISAVEGGQPVRMVIQSPGQSYATAAQNLWVKNGAVYAQNVDHVSVTFSGTVLKFQDNAYHWMIIVSTQGDRDMSRWNVGEHVDRGHTSDKVAVKWFVG